MGRTTGLLQKGYTATSAIGARRLMKFGATDGTVVIATAAADRVIGIQSEIDCAIGERASAAMVGCIEELVAGGTIARGDSVVAGAAGAGFAAAPGAGVNVFAIGMAEISGVAGDIITVIIAPHAVQG